MAIWPDSCSKILIPKIRESVSYAKILERLDLEQVSELARLRTILFMMDTN